ncbi:MAG: glycosyltransferase family 4 protein [Chitinophagales bacterium]|nr:glycosyltransferase family 4 protein [Chitinophagaceae bacterium]MCB9065396.1 glycosyltransferase family 4 protein [Chitinophagales bacterium]
MSKKLNIIYIGNKLAVHGRTPTAIDNLIPLFREEGHTVHFASSRKNKALRFINMLVRVWQYRKVADVVLIDTYSTFAFYYAWLIAMWCNKLDVRYIPILHGGNLPERLKSSPKYCDKLFGESFNNICVSSYLQEHMQQHGYKSTIIENTILLENYPYKHRTVVHPQLLWVRAFHKTYNPLMAIRVVDTLRKDYPDVHLTMVGPELDGSMEECKKLCAELKLHEQIKFTGKLSKKEWIDLAGQHDIFINTTNYDNQPVSIIEAMALGLPIVSTNVGGIPQLIEHNINGLLSGFNDVTAMNKNIQLLLKDMDCADRLSKNGRTKAEEFGWKNIKRKWAMLFYSIHE